MKIRASLVLMVIALLSSSIFAVATENMYPGIFTNSPIALPAGLTVEEYLLKKEPTGDMTEPLFYPVRGTVGKIQKKHNKERETAPSGGGSVDHTNRKWRVQIDNDKIDADYMKTEMGGREKITVKLTNNGKTILHMPVGDDSPVDPIQGLWSYGNHWVLEVALCRVTEVTKNNRVAAYTDCIGEVIQDGTSFSKRRGYQESFGFQLIKGKPFYFFKKKNQIGVSYDNQEILLAYSEVPHHKCCEPSILNPMPSRDMVSFFARRDKKWYYVEIGVFKK